MKSLQQFLKEADLSQQQQAITRKKIFDRRRQRDKFAQRQKESDRDQYKDEIKNDVKADLKYDIEKAKRDAVAGNKF